MPYPKKLLNDFETMALDLHPHWWYFAEAAFALAASIILGIVVLALDGASWIRWVVLALIVISAGWLLAKYVRWRTTNFVITSDRVIFRHGVIAKSGIEIPLERVNSVHFNQSIFERMVGAGDLLIESGAEEGQQRFSDIKNPDRVQNLIHSQMEVNQTNMYGGRGGSAPTDIATQLEKLEGLRDRGALSGEDFEAQKRRLLDG
ncbi:MAG: PH domain-containing protein [Actinomycetota bacterium]|nr:PH domain-containing protein [Acidimicrobiia bacterium]MDQ3470759.1 PH domain-containing protein [Actinomycetota bacterium]